MFRELELFLGMQLIQLDTVLDIFIVHPFPRVRYVFGGLF